MKHLISRIDDSSSQKITFCQLENRHQKYKSHLTWKHYLQQSCSSANWNSFKSKHKSHHAWVVYLYLFPAFSFASSGQLEKRNNYFNSFLWLLQVEVRLEYIYQWVNRSYSWIVCSTKFTCLHINILSPKWTTWYLKYIQEWRNISYKEPSEIMDANAQAIWILNLLLCNNN